MVDEALVFAAAEVARASGASWKTFLHELEIHVKRQDLALRNSPHEFVHTFQGSAREAAYLLDLFRDATATVEKLKAGSRRSAP